MSRSLRLLILVAIALAAPLRLATPAIAQGADQHFARPMSWATLRSRMEQLSPAEAQWADMQAAHDDYLLEMDEFRTGPIARWLNDHGTGVMVLMVQNPEKAKAARLELASLQLRLGSIDDDFFARAGRVLGEDQQLALERMRLRRARDRMLDHRGAVVSLELVDHIDPQLLDVAIKGALYDWEDRRTSLLKTHAAAELAKDNALGKLLSSYAGPFAQDPEDPELAMDLGRALRAALEEARKPVEASKAALRAHGWQGVRTLTALLPLKEAHRLRLEVLPVFGLQVSEHFLQNLREAGISEDIPAVKAVLEDYWDDMEGLTNTAVLAAAPFTNPGHELFIMAGGDDGDDPWRIAMEGIENAKAPLQDRIRQVNRALGDLGAANTDLSKAIHERLAETTILTDNTTAVFMISADGGDLPDGGMVIGSSMSFDGDAFFGGASMMGFRPLPSALRDRLIRDMALDKDGVATLDLLLKDHADALEAAGEALTQAMVSDGDNHQPMLASFNTNTQGREITESADVAFFDALEVLAQGDAVESHRQTRQRSLNAGGGGMMSMITMGFGGGDGQLHNADPTEALERADIDPAAITNALGQLDDWHASATAAAQQFAEARDAQAALFNAQIQRQMGDQGASASINFSSSDASKMGAAQQRIEQAQAALGDAYRAGLEQAIDGMNELNALKVRRRWLQHAYPSVLRRGDPLAPSFAHAMELPDLTETQRGAITMLHVEHDDAWWASSMGMIDDMSNAGVGLDALISGDDPDSGLAAFEAMQHSKQELDRKKFARREAALKQLAALRDILAEDQLARLNGLPDPTDRSRHPTLSF